MKTIFLRLQSIVGAYHWSLTTPAICFKQSKSVHYVFLLLCLGLFAKAQNFYSTNTGETTFFSETPVEDISAVNKMGQAILNTTTNDIVVQMNMKQFDFPNKLMQEHFNENYIESDKYPKAVFKGKINEKIDFSKNGKYDVSATGEFLLHGTTQSRTLKGIIDIKDKMITLVTDFDVALTDHKIDVPKLVFVKVAQVIKVKNKYVLTPYVAKK